MNIVEMRNIEITYKLQNSDVKAVRNVDFDIEKGKITALVGESGCGKTTLASSLLKCISEPGELTNGSITYYDSENPIRVDMLDENQLQKFRWEKISMVFQASQNTLNPVMTIFEQFYETGFIHSKMNKSDVKKLMSDILSFVNLKPENVLDSYPHELSGGMKQRVMIAFSLMLNPGLIILDEPTTALDVITQDHIFKILKRINEERNISMLLLTHDMGVVAKFADYVAVMYAGKIVEKGPVYDVFKNSKHPYTKGLINATPSLVADFDIMHPIEGTPPDLRKEIKGCAFCPRCKYKMDICSEEEPEIKTIDKTQVQCWREL